jgi:Zn-dependent protease
MINNLRNSLGRLGRDRIFWLIVAALFVVYAVFEIKTESETVLRIVLRLLALVVAITVHECAHAWSADLLGDPTARMLGRVTLNPLRHLDPMGTVMMVVTTLTGMGIGWGKPTPITPFRLRYGTRRGRALVSLAGPASNLAVALLAGLILRVFGVRLLAVQTLYLFMGVLISTNIIIALFNLLPIPPLDGYSVLIGLLALFRGAWSWTAISFLEGLERYGSMLLLGLVLVPPLLGINLLGWVIGPPFLLIYRLIVGA